MTKTQSLREVNIDFAAKMIVGLINAWIVMLAWGAAAHMFGFRYYASYGETWLFCWTWSWCTRQFGRKAESA